MFRTSCFRHSLTSSYDRSSVGKTGDTRSLTSAVSEISVDITGPGQAGGAARQGEDTQSMVPLTGSLGDLHLDLEMGSTTAGTSEPSSTIANPEQATPVVSVSMGAYTISFMESGEINGNSDDDNVHVRDPSSQDSSLTQASVVRGGEDGNQAREPLPPECPESEAQEGIHTSGPAGEDLSISHEQESLPAGQPVTGAEGSGDGVTEAEQSDERNARKESSEGAESGQTPLGAPQMKSGCNFEVAAQDDSDNGSEDSKASEAEVLVPEGNSGEGGAASSDRDTSDPEVLSQGEMTSSKESAVSSSDKEASEPELLGQEGDAHDSEAATSTDNREEAPEPESCGQEVVTMGKEPAANSGARDGPAEQEESGSGKDAAVSAENADGSHAAAGDKGDTVSGSDSGSSDGNKDTWDMLSDSAPDSN